MYANNAILTLLYSQGLKLIYNQIKKYKNVQENKTEILYMLECHLDVGN